MFRTLFISVFLSIYILIVGPPLIVYTLLSNNPDPIYWAGINGVMFFVRLAGVRVRVVGTGTYSARHMFVRRQSHQFDRRPSCGERYPTAHRDFVERVDISLAGSGPVVPGGAIHSSR